MHIEHYCIRACEDDYTAQVFLVYLPFILKGFYNVNNTGIVWCWNHLMMNLSVYFAAYFYL
jgi:hypothetical protein